MKKILITGKNSYIGNYFTESLKDYPEAYKIDYISLRADAWKKEDLSTYDCVFHVAGLAHVRETEENKDQYYKINRDLAVDFASYCKDQGVAQFIFLSSMSVYGLEKGNISPATELKPNSHYGKSKLEAEKLLEEIETKDFKIAIVRPPMVYGKDTKGNYPRLSALAKKTPIFPRIDNKRSMIYIENLSEFIRLLIDDGARGVFLPQNSEYVNTSDMVGLIGEIYGRKILFTRLFNPIIRLLNIGLINKVFGDLVYEKELSAYPKDYNKVDFETSIKRTEG